jgi:hypothetical protein
MADAFEFDDTLTPEQVQQGKSFYVGYQEISCLIIFDVKMDLTRKARFVAGGHVTETPASITYSSVVSRDSVRIAFLIAALNKLDVIACDVGNAYLNTPCRERFASSQGQSLVLGKALLSRLSEYSMV